MHMDCPVTDGPAHHHANVGSGHKLDEDRVYDMNPIIHDNIANATHQGITEMIISPNKIHDEFRIQVHSPDIERRKSSLKKRLPSGVHQSQHSVGNHLSEHRSGGKINRA